MRLARTSALVALLLLGPLIEVEAQAPAGAGNAGGGFNPVPYLAGDVDRAKDAYDDAQDNRDLAMEKLRATAKDYGHAMTRLEVKDNAETQAAFEKAKQAYETAKGDYAKARKLRDDASETFFKIRTAAEKASSANATPEPPITSPAPAASTAIAPAMTQAETDAAWHRWTDATIKEWQAQRAERAALDAAEAARKAARAAPTDTAAGAAYFDAVRKAQAATDATEAARAAVPPAPTPGAMPPIEAVNPAAVAAAETKTPAATPTDADPAQAARGASDAVRAAADNKAWQARAAAQAAADKAAAARAAAKAAPTDTNAISAYFNALSAARAAADAAAAAKAEADRVWNAHAALPAGRTANGVARTPSSEARIWDDGNDPDDPFADVNEAALGYGDEDRPTTVGPDVRMGFDDVDQTPAPATKSDTTGANATPPATDRWAAAGAAARAAETAQKDADAARAEAMKPRSTKAETDAMWDKAMAAQRNAAAAGARANAAIDEARKNDPPHTQEKPGTSRTVANAADAAILKASLEYLAGMVNAWKEAQAEAKTADAALVNATEEVGAAQAEAKAAHATKNTAREDMAWDKWRTAIYNRKWARAKAEMKKTALMDIFHPPRGTRQASADDPPRTQERPGTGTSPEQSGWRTPSEGAHSPSLQRAAPTETSPSNQPTAEQLRRAAQLYPADSGQGGVFVPTPLAPAPPLNATVPVATRAVQPQTPSTRTAAQIPSASPPATTVPGAPTAPPNLSPGQPVSAVTTPPSKAPASGFGGSWNGDSGCGFTTLTISDQGASLLLQGIPGNGAITAASDGTTAHAQGVVMYAQPNHQLTLRLSGNQLAFQASSATGSCSESFRRQ